MMDLQELFGRLYRGETMTGLTATSAVVSGQVSSGWGWQESDQPKPNAGPSLYLEPSVHDDRRQFQLPHSGLSCQHCGEHLPRVSHTRTTPGFILRERHCSKCGRIITTSERIVGTRERIGKRSFSDPCRE